jgi:hypothetical protein
MPKICDYEDRKQVLHEAKVFALTHNKGQKQNTKTTIKITRLRHVYMDETPITRRSVEGWIDPGLSLVACLPGN